MVFGKTSTPHAPSCFRCWINEDDNGAWEFGAYYAPLVVIILVTAFCWIRVLFKVIEVHDSI